MKEHFETRNVTGAARLTCSVSLLSLSCNPLSVRIVCSQALLRVLQMSFYKPCVAGAVTNRGLSTGYVKAFAQPREVVFWCLIASRGSRLDAANGVTLSPPAPICSYRLGS